MREGVESGTVEVKVRWKDFRDLKTTYANQLLVTHAGKEFYLVFGELVPPAPGGDMPECVEIEPLVRIAVSPGAMLDIAKAIQDNMRRFVSKLEQSVAEQAEDSP